MMKSIFVIPVMMLASTSALAESCLSYDSTVTIDSSSNMDMIKRMQGSNKPQVTKNYMSARYWVSSYGDGWSSFDYQTGEILVVMNAQKAYMENSLKESGDKMPAFPGMPEAPGADFKADTKGNSKKTGKTLTIAGIPCEEVEKTKTTTASMQAMPRMPMTSVMRELSCESATQPTNYFAFKDAHAKAMLSYMPADKRAKLQAVQPELRKQERFALSKVMVTEAKLDNKKMKGAGQFAPGMPKSTTLISNLGTACAPDSYFKIPAGYKDLKAQFQRLGR